MVDAPEWTGSRAVSHRCAVFPRPGLTCFRRLTAAAALLLVAAGCAFPRPPTSKPKRSPRPSHSPTLTAMATATATPAETNVYAHTLAGDFSDGVRNLPSRVYVPNSK